MKPEDALGVVSVQLQYIRQRAVINVWLCCEQESTPSGKTSCIENIGRCIQEYKEQEGKTNVSTAENSTMGDLYRSQATSCTAARHNLEACKHFKDAREAGCQDAQEYIQDAYKETEGPATPAAVEQAGAEHTAANAAADGEADAAGKQYDEATAQGAAAVEAGAVDNNVMHPQDAQCHVNKLRTLSEEECEEAEEGCNSHSLSPAPDQGGPEPSGSIGQDTAEHEAAKEEKQAERQTAQQFGFVLYATNSD